MVWLSNLQKDTLFLVDKMITENKTFEEISNYLYNNDYIFSVKNNSKKTFRIEKIIRNKENNTIEYENTFVDLIKRRNGLASWETIKLS